MEEGRHTLLVEGEERKEGMGRGEGEEGDKGEELCEEGRSKLVCQYPSLARLSVSELRVQGGFREAEGQDAEAPQEYQRIYTEVQENNDTKYVRDFEKCMSSEIQKASGALKVQEGISQHSETDKDSEGWAQMKIDTHSPTSTDI